MLDIQRILVARDFSDSSSEALRYALDLARRTDAQVQLLLVDVLHADAYETAHAPRRDLDALRAELLDLTPYRFPAERLAADVIRDVAAAPAILRHADHLDADLIVMGTHGRRGFRHLMLGSVAEEVIRQAPCPVLTVHAPRKERDGIVPEVEVRRVLCPIDFSEHARLALAEARNVAEGYGARLDLLFVVEDRPIPVFTDTGLPGIMAPPLDPDVVPRSRSALEQLDRAVGPPLPGTTYNVGHGHPSDVIGDFARQRPSDLIVLTTHGLTGLQHLLIGSVAEKVTRTAPCPVLTLRRVGPHLAASPRTRLAETSAPS